MSNQNALIEPAVTTYASDELSAAVVFAAVVSQPT